MARPSGANPSLAEASSTIGWRITLMTPSKTRNMIASALNVRPVHSDINVLLP